MPEIIVEHNPDASKLEKLGVLSWPIWTCEPSEFPWNYDSSETCYLLDGDVIVTADGGTPVAIKAGDLVVFPEGMSCRWQVIQTVRKHYHFD
jgi:uncharacterized cupin superfamily protein